MSSRELYDPDEILARAIPVPCPPEQEETATNSVAKSEAVSRPDRRRSQKYASKALRDACSLVADAKSERHNTLRNETIGIAGLAAAGHIDGNLALDELRSAAFRCQAATLGEDPFTSSDIERTIDDAWCYGTARPRANLGNGRNDTPAPTGTAAQSLTSENNLTDLTVPLAKKAAAQFLQDATNAPIDAVNDVLANNGLLRKLALLKLKELPAFESLCHRLRHQAGVKQRDIDALTRSVGATAKMLADDNRPSSAMETPEPPLSKVLRSELAAQFGDSWLLPEGYSLVNDEDELGVFRIAESEKDIRLEPVALAPVVIVGRAKDLETKTELTKLAWRKDGRWETLTVPRKCIADSKKLVEFAAYGLPVDSTNASKLVGYFSVAEHRGVGQLSFTWTSSQQGWQSVQGEAAFLLGKEVLTSGGCVPLEFRAENPGDEQIAEAYNSREGSLDGWLKAINAISPRRYWRIQIAIYIAFAAVLLKILKAENFVVDYSAVTSTGKSSTLEVSASAFGNPDLRASNSVVQTWDITRVAFVLGATTRNDLPSFLDDTKRVKNAGFVGRSIYDFVAGQGRGRGSKDGGLTQTRKFRGVLASTGEAALESHTEDGGTRARVLGMWGSPFGVTDPETATVVNKIVEGVRTNHGHAARKYVQYLLEHEECWAGYREKFRQRSTAYAQKAGKNSIAGRRGGHVALVETAAEIAHAVFPELSWEYHPAIEELWSEVSGDNADTDLPLRALRETLDWAHAHHDKFWAVGDGASHCEPHQGYLGRWDDGEYAAPAFFGIQLKPFLEKLGHQADGILRSWRDRGWLDVDNEPGRLTKKTPFGPRGGSRGLYTLNLQALSAAGFSGDENNEDIPF